MLPLWPLLTDPSSATLTTSSPEPKTRSRRYTSRTAPCPGTRLPAVERNTMNRPSMLTDGKKLWPLPGCPAWFLLISSVVGAADAVPTLAATTSAVVVMVSRAHPAPRSRRARIFAPFAPTDLVPPVQDGGHISGDRSYVPVGRSVPERDRCVR